VIDVLWAYSSCYVFCFIITASLSIKKAQALMFRNIRLDHLSVCLLVGLSGKFIVAKRLRGIACRWDGECGRLSLEGGVY